jgi:putative IMPACT (imprinted ancient) family translation regulator
VPGLINAYRSAAQDAISKSEVIEKFIEVRMQITFPYSQLKDIYLFLRQNDCQIIGQNQEENCTIRFSIRLSKQAELISKHKQHPRLSHLSQLS